MWNEIKESSELTLTKEDIDLKRYKNVRIRQGRNSQLGHRKSVQPGPQKHSKIPIDPNHKYFLIIDDKDDGRSGFFCIFETSKS